MLERCYRKLCLAVGLATFLSFGGSKPSAEGAFHLWHVKEVFTNSDGSVQFVEMFDSYRGETLVSGYSLTANSDGNIKTFTFPGNLTRSTPGSLLIATAGFGSLPGAVAPDFTFDQGGVSGMFFDPNATSLTFTFNGSGDTMTFEGESLPKDGINLLTDAGALGVLGSPPNISAGVNSPTNLAGNTGCVDLPCQSRLPGCCSPWRRQRCCYDGDALAALIAARLHSNDSLDLVDTEAAFDQISL